MSPERSPERNPERPTLLRGVFCGLAAVLFVAILAPSAFAQNGEFPFIEISLGYGNLGLPDANGGTSHHSGFASQQNINFKRWFGIDNYIGYYSLGSNTTAFSNVFGAKLTARGVRLAPYGVAGLGWSRITLEPFGLAGSMMTTRLGGGVDIPLNGAVGLRADVSRMWLHTGDITGTGSTWTAGNNFSGGLILTLQ
ncbi:MAG TPA: outer membrane beta-barrel protein [Terriglobia bacterium]|nr:outer membrane beta-barrel protein [Terriglobia bacterium]